MNASAARMTYPLNPIDLMVEVIRGALVGGWRDLMILAGITTALCTSWKVEILKAIHDFSNPGDTFKMGLFKANASIVGTYGVGTTNYSDVTGNADELANGNGYTTGGVVLTNTTPTSSGTTAYTTPAASAQWTGATFTTRGCFDYNSSKANRMVFVYDFGADEPVVAGTLTVSMPANDNTHALLRVA